MPTGLSLQAFETRERPATDWVIEGLLKRNNTMLILGPPKKSCKSWLTLDMCWGLSEGTPLWGVPELKPPKQMRSVYFTQEDTVDDVQDRIEANFRGKRTANDRVWVVPKNLNFKFDTSEGQSLIQAELDAVVANVVGAEEAAKSKKGVIDVVAFDPMRRIHNGDENDSGTIAKIWEVIDRIHRRYGCATVIDHHTVKPPHDKSKFDPTDPFTGRGSGDIYGGGDAFVVVVPGGGTDVYRKVAAYFESKRGKPLPPAQLKVIFETGQVQFLGAGWPQEDEDVEL